MLTGVSKSRDNRKGVMLHNKVTRESYFLVGIEERLNVFYMALESYYNSMSIDVELLLLRGIDDYGEYHPFTYVYDENEFFQLYVDMYDKASPESKVDWMIV